MTGKGGTFSSVYPSEISGTIRTEIATKENDPNFTGDMEALLRTEIKYDQKVAFEWLKTKILKIES